MNHQDTLTKTMLKRHGAEGTRKPRLVGRRPVARAVILLSMGAIGCGGPETVEPTESGSHPIIGGVIQGANPFLGALYHRRPDQSYNSAGWYGRPCSGTIVRRDLWNTYYLTARHCVTTTGQQSGEYFLDPTNLKLATSLRPGSLGEGMVPKATARQGEVVSGVTVGIDVALVRVSGMVALDPPGRVAFNPSVNDYTWQAEVRGYGRTCFDSCAQCTTNCTKGQADWAEVQRFFTGAGTLRSGGLFTAAPPLNDPNVSIRFNMTTQHTGSGDSGAPYLVNNPALSEPKVVAVHSSYQPGAHYTNATAIASQWPWLMQAMGYVTLGTHRIKLGLLGVSRPERAPLTTKPYSVNSPDTRWVYSQAFRWLTTYTNNGQFAAYCADTDGVNAFADACDFGLTQQWEVTPDDQLRNVYYQTCLSRPSAVGQQLTLQPCTGSSSTAWLFYFQGGGRSNLAARYGYLSYMDTTFDMTSEITQGYGNGNSEDQYLVGDWDGDGRSNLAVRRDRWVYMDTNFDGGADIVQEYGNGNSEDEYLVGDWDGDGRSNLAVRRGPWVYMDTNFDGGADIVQEYGNGASEDEYLVGDWDGDGRSNLAVRRAAWVYMDTNFDGGGDLAQEYGNGNSEDEYLVGDWDGDGRSNLAVRRSALIYMDINFDGGGDFVQEYGGGDTVDQYLVGAWSQ